MRLVTLSLVLVAGSAFAQAIPLNQGDIVGGYVTTDATAQTVAGVKTWTAQQIFNAGAGNSSISVQSGNINLGANVTITGAPFTISNAPTFTAQAVFSPGAGNSAISMVGNFNIGAASSIVSGNYSMPFLSAAVSSGSAVGFVFDTTTAYVAGDKLLSGRSNGVEKWSVGNSGVGTFAGLSSSAGLTVSAGVSSFNGTKIDASGNFLLAAGQNFGLNGAVGPPNFTYVSPNILYTAPASKNFVFQTGNVNGFGLFVGPAGNVSTMGAVNYVGLYGNSTGNAVTIGAAQAQGSAGNVDANVTVVIAPFGTGSVSIASGNGGVYFGPAVTMASTTTHGGNVLVNADNTINLGANAMQFASLYTYQVASNTALTLQSGGSSALVLAAGTSVTIANAVAFSTGNSINIRGQKTPSFHTSFSSDPDFEPFTVTLSSGTVAFTFNSAYSATPVFIGCEEKTGLNVNRISAKSSTAVTITGTSSDVLDCLAIGAH